MDRLLEIRDRLPRMPEGLLDISDVVVCARMHRVQSERFPEALQCRFEVSLLKAPLSNLELSWDGGRGGDIIVQAHKNL